MPGRPYTERFIASAVPNTWHVYVVPVGFRAVIRSVLANHVLGTGGSVLGTVDGVYFLNHSFPAAGPALQIETRAVAYEGQSIAMYSYAAGINMICTGYLLRDELGAVPADAMMVPELAATDTED